MKHKSKQILLQKERQLKNDIEDIENESEDVIRLFDMTSYLVLGIRNTR